MEKVWFITGANRGFGRAFAEAAVARGDKVIAGMRKLPADDPFYEQDAVLAVRADVTRADEVRQAAADGAAHFGRIDILFNNAGYGMSGAFEETSDEELRRLMETDYFGVVHTTRAVLPYMRQQERGMILNIASQGGLMGFPGSSAYCSAKFAVVGLSLVLREELAPFDIQVAAVCPGSFRTEFRSASSMKFPQGKLAAYEGNAAHQAAQFLAENTHNQSGDPQKAAQFLCQIIDGDNLPARILIGKDCCQQVKADLHDQLQDIKRYEQAASRTVF